MRFKTALLSLAALSMTAAPAAAVAAPAGGTVAGAPGTSARASTSTTHEQGLFGEEGGAGLFGIGILAGIIAIVVIAIVNDDNGNDRPNSP